MRPTTALVTAAVTTTSLCLSTALLSAAPAGAATVPPVWGAVTSRVTLAAGGGQSTGPNYCCATISAHGRYVAFESEATDLVRGDTNAQDDVFVRDRLGDVTQRVSVSSTGRQANGPSSLPTISDDGRLVAFTSRATNLVPGDTNGAADVFVRDTRAGTTQRVSVTAGGGQGAADSSDGVLSADGRTVAFVSDAALVPADTNGVADVYVRDLLSGVTRRVSVADDEAQGNERSIAPELSADGRFVAFTSVADNLVRGDTNGGGDLFLRDRATGRTTRVNLGPGGVQGRPASPFHAPFAESVSATGRFVSFSTDQSGLVPDDTNGAEDIYVRDTVAGRTERISTTADGRQLGAGALAGAMSGDGRLVMFWALQDGVVPGDTNGNDDLFVRDRLTGTTRLLSVGVSGRGANDSVGGGDISSDGRHMAFFAFASNLVRGDTNSQADVFVRDTAGGG